MDVLVCTVRKEGLNSPHSGHNSKNPQLAFSFPPAFSSSRNVGFSL